MSEADLNLYFIMVGDDPLVLLLYVDDLFITGREITIVACKKDLVAEYEMTDALFLGIGGLAGSWTYFLGQGKYVVDILRRFRMEDCRSMLTPMITNWKKLHASEGELVDPTLYCQLIGSLMYLINSRLDLCFAVNTLSQYMVELRRVH